MKARITPTRKLISETIPNALRAAILDRRRQIDAAKARPPAREPAERDRDFAEEREEVVQRLRSYEIAS